MASTGSLDVTLNCLSMGSDCKGTIPPSIARSIVSDEIWNKYTNREQTTSLTMSDDGSLLICQWCRYAIQQDPSKAAFDFKCPVCKQLTCSECQRKSHGNRSCAEAERRNSDLIKSISDKMSEESIRICSNTLCRLPYLKSGGCSHMLCTCGTATCFVCRKDISAEHYKHFCDTPHCQHRRCGKCPLWVSKEREEREIELAGYRVANQVKAPSKLIKSIMNERKRVRVGKKEERKGKLGLAKVKGKEKGKGNKKKETLEKHEIGEEKEKEIMVRIKEKVEEGEKKEREKIEVKKEVDVEVEMARSAEVEVLAVIHRKRRKIKEKLTLGNGKK